MRVKILFCLLLIILFPAKYAYAKFTDEIEINTLYKKAYSIVYEKLDITNLPNVDSKKALESLNCIIEILNKKPDSIEAYYSMYLLKSLMKAKLNDKYAELKIKHLPHLNDPDFETGEKLVFLALMVSQTGDEDNGQLINNTLFQIRDNCKNKNFSALATELLSNIPNQTLECYKKFIELVPNHPAVPYIMAEIISIENENDLQQCVQELQNLINKYGNIKTPNGWRMACEYYFFIAYAYVDAKDYANAKKYYEIIQKEAPDFCDLICLKTALDYINQ